MPGRARRHKDRRNRRRDCGDSLREGVWRSGRAADARDLARYAGAVRADARRTLSAQREKGFFRREGTCPLLTGKPMCDWPLNLRTRLVNKRILKLRGHALIGLPVTFCPTRKR